MYFDNTQKQQHLIEILESWLGTPFKFNCGVKQRGVDCTYFVIRVMEEVGALPPNSITVAPCAKDWFLHGLDNLLVDGFRQNPLVEELPHSIASYQTGDIILYRFGRFSSHAAIYADRYIYSAMNRYGVCKFLPGDVSILKQPTHLFRVK